jgi:RHS repeat-associated protein
MTNNGNTQFYSYGAQPDAVTQVGSTSYTYDANGNMTNRGIQIITWNVDNQPATISGGTSFVYDGKGNRVEETTGGQTTVYINQYYQKNITTGVVTTYYYLGSQLVAQNTGSTLRYVGQDNVGSTSTMTTSTGTLDSSISYYPFGAVESGSVNTVKQFTGQILDSTGLYYYNARYYDPTIGRFISADTVLQNYDNPQTLNRYSYCQNNPLTYNDPTGHFAIFAAMAIGAAIGAAVNVGIYAVQHRGSYTGEGFAKAALTGAVSGALAVIPIPGLQILASSLITGAVSGITSWAVGTAMDDVTGNYNQSESSLPAMIASGLGGAVGGSVGTIIGSIATPLAGSLGQQSTLAGSIGQQLTQDSYQALTTNTGRDFTVSTLASAVPSSLAGQISSNIIDPDYQSNSQTPQSGGTYNVTGPVVAFQWWLYDPDGE